MSGKKPKTKSPKKSEPKAAKRRRFVKGLIKGKSMRQAALDAGYTQSMADKAGDKILPGAQAEFRDALAKTIPLEKLLGRIAEGLDAQETKLAQHEGFYTDARDLIAWSERRAYAELAAKLMGYLTTNITGHVELSLTDRRDRLKEVFAIVAGSA